MQANVKRMPSIKMTFASRIGGGGGGGGASGLHEASSSTADQGMDKKHKKKVS